MTKDYSMLPETMESAEIEALTKELLDQPEADSSISNADVAEALIQLILRQAYNYAPFSDQVAHRVQRWVEKVWSDEDPDLDDALSMILINIPTEEGKRFLEKATRSKNKKVRQLAEETLHEMP